MDPRRGRPIPYRSTKRQTLRLLAAELLWLTPVRSARHPVVGRRRRRLVDPPQPRRGRQGIRRRHAKVSTQSSGSAATLLAGHRTDQAQGSPARRSASVRSHVVRRPSDRSPRGRLPHPPRVVLRPIPAPPSGCGSATNPPQRVTQHQRQPDARERFAGACRGRLARP